MITKNINFKEFNKKKLSNFKFKIKKFKRVQWTKKYPLLKSFTKSFKYSYSKKDINKYKFYKDFRLIGMGGSILGTKAIYEFLKHKIKKKVYFIDNLEVNKNEYTDTDMVVILINKDESKIS